MLNLSLPFSEPTDKRKEKDRLEVHNRMRGTRNIRHLCRIASDEVNHAAALYHAIYVHCPFTIRMSHAVTATHMDPSRLFCAYI